MANRPVTLLTPFLFCDATDIVAQRLHDELGGTFIVVNPGCASTAVGAAAVASAKRDGTTFLFSSATTFVTTPHIGKNP